MAIQGNEPLTQQRYQEIEEVFSRALDLPENERIIWLKKYCSNDSALFKEVSDLLQSHSIDTGFLENDNQLSLLAESITQSHLTPTKPIRHSGCPDLTGRKIGHYHVIKQINEGGMGRVYLARRDDGEYDKVVAIKVVEVKGLETDLFRKERQILANLEHPNIVTLLDGGTLPEGFPYLVMEHIDGLTINTFVAEKHYTDKQIVSLCIKLCQVVHRSHQHGVIHCDIKPDNILVTHNAELKLLDFGIAQSLVNADTTANNNFSAFALTPEYASPQRHEHKPPHVTDDIYSIGVILAQLLSQKPFPKLQKTSRFKQHYLIADTEAMASHINNLELRSIFRKATHDNSEQRYDSANALAYDLENWIANRPVNALGSDLPYRSLKHFDRRWKWWGIALVILGLLYQPIHTLMDYQKKQERLDAVIYEAEDMINYQSEIRHMDSIKHHIITQQETTEQGVETLEKLISEFPQNLKLMRMLADHFRKLGTLTGHPFLLSMDNTAKAQTYYIKAYNLYEILIKKNYLEPLIKISDKLNAIDALMEVSHHLAAIQVYTGSYSLGYQTLMNLLDKRAKQKNNPQLPFDPIQIALSITAIDALILQKKIPQAQQWIEKIDNQLPKINTLALKTKELSQLSNRHKILIARLNEQKLIIHYLNYTGIHKVMQEGSVITTLKKTLEKQSTSKKQLKRLYTTYFQPLAKNIQTIIDHTKESNDLHLLNVRIENILGCVALKIDQPTAALQHLTQIINDYRKVNLHNAALSRIDTFYNNLYTNLNLTVEKRLQCNNPYGFLYVKH